MGLPVGVNKASCWVGKLPVLRVGISEAYEISFKDTEKVFNTSYCQDWRDCRAIRAFCGREISYRKGGIS
jgi:hypothetical protein